jgi:hypothetical protein
MRTHDEESLQAPKHGHVRERENDPNALDLAVAHRAVADHRPDTLGARSVMHLQRAAGNSSVGSLLQEERSPVLDVVGRGGGQAIDKETRSHMEGAMGHDFGDVRVHTGGEASKSAVSVQASAYTVGNDIVFGGGNYEPGSDSGKRMLAHELTHVVQQRSGAVDGTPQAGGISVSDPSDRFERAAEENADRVVSGHEGHDHGAGAGGGAPSVQRAAEPMPDEDRSVQRTVQRTGEEGEEETEGDAAVQRTGEEGEQETEGDAAHAHA